MSITYYQHPERPYNYYKKSELTFHLWNYGHWVLDASDYLLGDVSPQTLRNLHFVEIKDPELYSCVICNNTGHYTNNETMPEWGVTTGSDVICKCRNNPFSVVNKFKS